MNIVSISGILSFLRNSQKEGVARRKKGSNRQLD